MEKRKYDRAHFYDRYDLDGDGVVRSLVGHEHLCLCLTPVCVRYCDRRLIRTRCAWVHS